MYDVHLASVPQAFVLASETRYSVREIGADGRVSHVPWSVADMTFCTSPKLFRHQCGTANAMLLFLAVLILVPLVAIGFYEGRKAYWDAQVKEMCARDGGVTVFERVLVSQSEFRRWGGVGSVLGIPHESDARYDIPYFRRTKDEVVHSDALVVMRLETMFVRRLDNKLLGRSVHYYRRGGDFPSWAHESSFGCTRPRLPVEGHIFILQGDSK